jgi:hypothetical protein
VTRIEAGALPAAPGFAVTVACDPCPALRGKPKTIQVYALDGSGEWDRKRSGRWARYEVETGAKHPALRLRDGEPPYYPDGRRYGAPANPDGAGRGDTPILNFDQFMGSPNWRQRGDPGVVPPPAGIYQQMGGAELTPKARADPEAALARGVLEDYCHYLTCRECGYTVTILDWRMRRTLDSLAALGRSKIKISMTELEAVANRFEPETANEMAVEVPGWLWERGGVRFMLDLGVGRRRRGENADTP